jgi:FtsH ternary system domain X2
MCNPRQIRVRATRHLAQAWEQEVRRQITLRGQARGQARLREPLEATMGAPVMAALDRVLGTIDGWQAHPDGYRHAVDGGYVHFHADTRELEIVAEVAGEVAAAGTAGTTVRGSLDETIDVEGVGRYYDDGWGGRTAETARHDAGVHAAAEIERAAAARLAQAREEAETANEERVLAQARAAAQAALDRATAERAAALDQAAGQTLTTVGVQARAHFHRALAEAYREAILAYARSRRASHVQLSDHDGVLDIEFEMEA